MPEPVTRCGACRQTDDHPKHQIAIGIGFTSNGRKLYDEHDFELNGVVFYHFDCPTEWNDLANRLPTVPILNVANPWEVWPETEAAKHRAVAEVHAAITSQAKSGLHGDDLRQWIHNLNVSGGAGGIDQTLATAILAALAINSSTATVGSKTITGPLNMRLMTANGSDSSAGTQLGAGGGYSLGGTSISFGTASAATVVSNANTSWTNMPSCTLTGMEEWDSSGSPLRTFWAPWSGGPIVVGSGNTFTVASGSLTNTLS